MKRLFLIIALFTIAFLPVKDTFAQESADPVPFPKQFTLIDDIDSQFLTTIDGREILFSLNAVLCNTHINECRYGNADYYAVFRVSVAIGGMIDVSESAMIVASRDSIFEVSSVPFRIDSISENEVVITLNS